MTEERKLVVTWATIVLLTLALGFLPRSQVYGVHDGRRGYRARVSDIQL
jgi:hypothetical protein